MKEPSMPGGRTAGAVRRGTTVVRRGGPWTHAVHSVLRHLEAAGFTGAPHVIGFETHGQEVLSYLDGHTVGDRLPWPTWVHSDAALTQVGRWLRALHDTTAAYVPEAGLTWFAGQSWRPGLVIGHHDAAPYNAVWNDDGLVGFVDWDTAGPSSRDLDLAFTALSWVPLQPPHVVRPQGFTAFEDRSRRLHLLLDAYGYTGDRAAFGLTIAHRARMNAAAIKRLAVTGDLTYTALLPTATDLEQAATALENEPATFWQAHPVRSTTPHPLDD